MFHPFQPSVIVAVLLLTVLPGPGLGVEGLTADAPSPAAAVLERFTAGQQEDHKWPSETIEIEASLPKLKKTGRLVAVRTLSLAGLPHYQVLETAGDSIVKNQLIVRYLAADERSASRSSSLALIPANYKIHYAGTVRLGSRLAYVFRVVPRKKRMGLITGVLWLDAETAIAVRESGYLAKSPSFFLKRVNLTRENELRDGSIEARITHVSVETRLVGRAQLVIAEHPASGASPAAAETAAEGQ